MRMTLPILLLAMLAAQPALAARASALDSSKLAGANRYERCLSMVKSDPRDANTEAERWHTEGGGAAALHCDALALVAMHRYAEAGERLDEAALAAPAKAHDVRQALYDQSGNAWLLANRPEKAEAALDAALALTPHDEDILFDRARARAARRNWAGAEADLSLLLSIDPNRADAYVLRASARHAEGRLAEANIDIARALQVYPDYPEALVERGAMKFEEGDVKGARADWQLAAHDEPDGDAGAAARARLAALDATAAKPKGK